MAAIVKKVDIEGFDKVFEVRELTVDELIDLFDRLKDVPADMSVMNLVIDRMDLLSKVGNVTLKDLKAMAPSDIENLYNKFVEANNSFFKVARTLGFDQMMASVRAALVNEFYELFVTAKVGDSEKVEN